MEGETVLVTGAAGAGVGEQVALQFAALGALVVALDINKQALAELKTKAEGMGYNVMIVVCDLSDKKQIKRMAADLKRSGVQVDVLVNNAAVANGKYLLDASDEELERTMQVNLFAHMWLIREFLPGMIDRDQGHIVTISSALGVVGMSRLADYSATKFGAFGLTEALRFELQKQGKAHIKTTVVCPGMINTPMYHRFGSIPMKFPIIMPLLEPSEIASRVVRCVTKRNEELVLVPRLLWAYFALRLLPVRWFDAVMRYLGWSSTFDLYDYLQSHGEEPAEPVCPSGDSTYKMA